MSEPVIRVEHLSKRYIIGHQRSKEDGFRHVIEDAARAPLKWLRSRREQTKAEREEFWALKDISFEVQQGDVVGIIGRNGAGKSTLLKILSRITEPTNGRIQIDGRVASLLEVGTGFHQELTGRENIFLNGAILGMSRVEIRRKFDEIVAFSEIEKFLDTPVKRYSSGMYVRLAFAVAAHLEPEILIVDEVLAVGDAAFQKKCLGKMDEVSRHGRTILFVSHNMGVISRLCKKALLIKAGQIETAGETTEVISHFMTSNAKTDGLRKWNSEELRGCDPAVRPLVLRVLTANDKVGGHVETTRPFQVEFQYQITKPTPRFRITYRFLTGDGAVAFQTSDSATPDYDLKPIEPGTYSSRCFISADLLNEGQYIIRLSIDIPFHQILFVDEGAIEIRVEQTGGVNSRFPEKWPGAVCPALDWKTEPLPAGRAALS